MFKVGDKVRMLRSSEEGFVVKVKDKQIDIETSDGFVLPVLVSDLVKVAEAEKDYFQKETPVSQVIEEFVPKEISEPQIILAFEPINDLILRPHLINNSNKEYFFVLSIKSDGEFKNFASGNCKPESEVKIYEDLQKKEFDQWNKWQIQLLSFDKDQNSAPTKNLYANLKASKLFKEKEKFLYSSKEGYSHIISLNQEESVTPKVEVGDNAFYEAFYFNKERSIDLHADALEIKETPQQTILEQQFSFFQKELDLSIADYVVELTVIHGVGNGVLKRYIHKDLAKNEHVEWFREANKEKFGYGATLVHFKA